MHLSAGRSCRPQSRENEGIYFHEGTVHAFTEAGNSGIPKTFRIAGLITKKQKKAFVYQQTKAFRSG